ncbi:MAG: arginine--tRNA ligase [Candidatus Omnitrophota bacterium]
MEPRLKALIQASLETLAKEKRTELPAGFDFDLSIAKDPAHGDYSTNAAFRFAKVLRTNPKTLAEEFRKVLAAETAARKLVFLERTESAGSGFINFFLKKGALASTLKDLRRQDERFGASDFGQGKKVLLEYVSANPTGPLTVAHGRQAAIGDSLARILAFTGHAVYREYYLNDAGRQIRILGESLWARYREALGREAPLPEDGYRGAYLVALAKKLAAEKKDSLLANEAEGLRFCTAYAKDAMMKTIESDLASFRVEFDRYFSESSLYQNGEVEKSLEALRGNGYLYESEGALWFKSTDFGDDKDRVLRKSIGEYTYLSPDIAYHRHKFERGHQMLVNLWGPDHHGYIPRLVAACKALGFTDRAVVVRIVQLVTLYRDGQPVRMSTRAGEFVTLQELMEEVGVDAARFFFIMRRVESPLDFDLDLAKQKSQDNPVYYLQYAHARIASLLKFANRKIPDEAAWELLSAPEETALIKTLTDLPPILVQASQMLEPYRLADYLREVATAFHKFYSLHRIVTEDEARTQARLVLADATRIVLRNGLRLLGISQPESM